MGLGFVGALFDRKRSVARATAKKRARSRGDLSECGVGEKKRCGGRSCVSRAVDGCCKEAEPSLSPKDLRGGAWLAWHLARAWQPSEPGNLASLARRDPIGRCHWVPTGTGEPSHRRWTRWSARINSLTSRVRYLSEVPFRGTFPRVF